MKIYHLKCNWKVIPCYITYKKVKNINLRINSNQKVKISAPLKAEFQLITEFIESKKVWIDKKINKFEQMININPKTLKNNDYLFYLGKKYKIVIGEGDNYVKIEDGNFYIYTINKNQESIKKIYDQWQKKESDKILKNITNEMYPYFQNYGIRYPNIRVKKMYTRWGSCSFSKGNINLNQYLVTLPKDVIKYVVIHELAHFIEPNHSKKFYKLIEKFIPNYNVYRNHLKNIRLK